MFQTSINDFFNIIANEYSENLPCIIVTKSNYDVFNFIELKKRCPDIHICIIGKDKVHVSEHILGFTWFEDCFNFASNFSTGGIYIVTSISEKDETIEWLKINKEDSHIKISDRISKIFDVYCVFS